MGLIDLIFGRPKAIGSSSYFKLMNGYTPVFQSWSGSLYESELVRAAIDTRARHISKLQIAFTGSGATYTRTHIQHTPNGLQTWSQFLYQLSTILDMRNTAFIVPTIDNYGRVEGLYVVAPQSWELLDVKGQPWIRMKFENGGVRACPLREVGIMTKFQYKNELFGESNRALADTMDLISIQRQGITESAKNSASYRFMAKVSNFTKPEDLAKERQRFDKENFQSGGGGMLLMPNTYTDIKQLNQQSFSVDAAQLQLIQQNVFNYYGVSESLLQNKAYGDEFSAFYEGVVEPFSIQLSDVITRMLYTEYERSFMNCVTFTANRLQFMTNKDKLDVSAQMLDRGIMTINEVRALWNLAPVEGGDERIARGEYYNADDKLQPAGDEPQAEDPNEEEVSEDDQE